MKNKKESLPGINGVFKNQKLLGTDKHFITGKRVLTAKLKFLKVSSIICILLKLSFIEIIFTKAPRTAIFEQL